MENTLFKKISSVSSWRLYSFAIIIFFTFLQIMRWPLFPLFIDIYYHLSVVEGFNQAGGYVAQAFWEYAPFGRPHLYPPLMHLLMVLLYKLGIPLISIARIFNFMLYPLILLVLWRVIKNIFGERISFFCLLLISSSYTFYLSILNNLPASLTLILLLLIVLSIEKNKILAGSIFMVFSFYTHFFMSLVSVLTFILWGFLYRQRLKTCLKIVFMGLFLSLPLLLYQGSNLKYFVFRDIKENYLLELNPFILLFFILGVIIAWRKKEKYYFFLSLAAGALPLIFIYKYRYFCAQGLTSFIFLAAVSLDSFYAKFSSFRLKAANATFLLVIFIFFFIFSPNFLTTEGKTRFQLFDSTFSNFVLQPNIRSNERSVYFPKLYAEIIKFIKDNTEPNDIIYSNIEYVAGIFGSLTGRATSCAMLFEIRPKKIFDPVKEAKLIIWIKDRDPDRSLEPKSLIDEYRLQKVLETEIAYVYKNPATGARRIIPPALIRLPAVFCFLFICSSLIALDFLR